MERRFYSLLKRKLRLGSEDDQLLKTAPKERTSQKNHAIETCAYLVNCNALIMTQLWESTESDSVISYSMFDCNVFGCSYCWLHFYKNIKTKKSNRYNYFQ